MDSLDLSHGPHQNAKGGDKKKDHFWYALSVYAGSEESVAQALRESLEKEGFGHCFSDVLIPFERISRVEKGERVDIHRNLFSGYLFVCVQLIDEVWHLINAHSRVLGFIGGKRPRPIPLSEIEAVQNRVLESVERAASAEVFEIGDPVVISGDAFDGFAGVIEEVDPEKKRARVVVQVFNRPTSVDVKFQQIERLRGDV